MLGAFVVSALSCVLAERVWHRIGGPLLNGLLALYRRILAVPLRKGWVRK